MATFSSRPTAPAETPGRGSSNGTAHPARPRTGGAESVGHLAVVMWLAVLAACLALAGPPAGRLLSDPGWLWLRLPLGLTAVLALPGHALTTLLFPRAVDLDASERLGFAVGLSLAQLPLLALLLDRSPWGLSPVGVVVSLCWITGLWCVVALVRLGRLAPAERFAGFAWDAHRTWSRSTGRGGKAGLVVALVGGVAVLGAGLSVAVGGALLTRIAWPPMTEFYMVGAKGLAEDYPREAAPNEPVGVTLGIVNHEGRPTRYRIVIWGASQVLAETAVISIAPGETWSSRIEFALPEYGSSQQVEITLLREPDPRPYRYLRLVLDVPPPGDPTPVRPVHTPTPQPRPGGAR